MPQRCYIHGPTTTAGTCPTCDAIQRDARDAEITRIRARLAEAEAVIKPFADLSAVFSKHDADELWCYVRLLHLRAAAQWMKENKP